MKKVQLAMPKVSKEMSLGSVRSYRSWILDLRKRYKAMQCKAAVAVNSALIEFYWNLGKDISERYPGKVRDAEFYKRLSADLKSSIPSAGGLSVSNLKYMRYFYALYAYRQQVVDDKELSAVAAELSLIPWGHHINIIDKCKGDREKALFYVRRTIQNGWSRNSLLNWLSTDLYEREGKGQTNFALTMPSEDCDLAQQLVKDPQIFEVFGLKEKYDIQAQLAKCYADAEAQFAVTAPKTKKGKVAK